MVTDLQFAWVEVDYPFGSYSPAPNETVHPWTDANGIHVEKGVMGLDAPPIAVGSAPYAGLEGSLLTSLRHTARPVDVPLYLTDAESVSDNVVRPMAAAFRNAGHLRVTTTPDVGAPRSRDLQGVVYQAGLEGDLRAASGHHQSWRKVPIALEAMDPYWYDATYTEVIVPDAGVGSVAFDDAGTGFDDTAVPFNGATGVQVNPGGDLPVYPHFQVNGVVAPDSRVELWENTNEGGPDTSTLIGAWELAVGFPTADTLVVDHRPASPFYGPRFASAGGWLPQALSWEYLKPGADLFQIPADSYTDGNRYRNYTLKWLPAGGGLGTQLRLNYQRRWWTP